MTESASIHKRPPASVRQEANQGLLTGWLGKAIRKLRIERGWKVSELAGRARVDPAMVKYWETGTSGPTLNRLPEVAEIFGVKASELVALAESIEAEKSA